VEYRWRIFENVFAICEQWVREVPEDYRPTPVLDRLTSLFSLCRVDSSTQRRCDELVSELRSTLDKAGRYENAVRSLRLVEEDPPQQCEAVGGLMAVCGSAAAVAHQLAHIELEKLSMVGVDELVWVLGHSSLEKMGEAWEEKEGVKGGFLEF